MRINIIFEKLKGKLPPSPEELAYKYEISIVTAELLHNKLARHYNPNVRKE